MIAVASLIAFLAGIAVERALARYGVRQAQARKAARHQLAMELSGPLNIEPCEFSGFWQERR